MGLGPAGVQVFHKVKLDSLAVLFLVWPQQMRWSCEPAEIDMRISHSPRLWVWPKGSKEAISVLSQARLRLIPACLCTIRDVLEFHESRALVSALKSGTG